MEISITQVAGADFSNSKAQLAVLESVAVDIRLACVEAGFKTGVVFEVKNGKAKIYYALKREAGKRCFMAPMAVIDSSKYGRSFIWSKKGLQTNHGRLDWIQKIYLNNMINDILDKHEIVAEIKTQFVEKMATNVLDTKGKEVPVDTKRGKIMYIRHNVVKGGIREFGRQSDLKETFCENDLYEKGLAPIKLPLRKFKTARADAIAKAVYNNEFNCEKEFSVDKLKAMIVEDISLVKFVIHNMGGKFLKHYGKQLESLNQDLAKYACEIDPRNANYFSSLDVQRVALDEHGLASIKLFTNPDIVLVGYVKSQWPRYEKVLAELERIKIANQHAPACVAVEPKKVRKAKKEMVVEKKIKPTKKPLLRKAKKEEEEEEEKPQVEVKPTKKPLVRKAIVKKVVKKAATKNELQMLLQFAKNSKRKLILREAAQEVVSKKKGKTSK